MMLYPPMNELLKKIDNRYLLVNITAKRARDIARDAEEREDVLVEKPVKIALEEIMDGKIILASEPADSQAFDASDIAGV